MVYKKAKTLVSTGSSFRAHTVSCLTMEQSIATISPIGLVKKRGIMRFHQPYTLYLQQHMTFKSLLYYKGRRYLSTLQTISALFKKY